MYVACMTREDTRSLPSDRVLELRRQERAHYARLKVEGALYAHYRIDDGPGNLLIFEVGSLEQMHRMIMLGPLALHQKTTIFPLMSIQALGRLTTEMATPAQEGAR